MTPVDQSLSEHIHEKSIILENGLKIWPKSQAEALATELPLKKVCTEEWGRTWVTLFYATPVLQIRAPSLF